MQTFEEFVVRHAWTEEEEWARPDTSDLVNFIVIVTIRVSIVTIVIIVTIRINIVTIPMIITPKLILILFRSGFDQNPLTWSRGTGT